MYLKSSQISDVKLSIFFYNFYIKIWNRFVIVYLLLPIFEAVCSKTPTALLNSDSVNTCSPFSRYSWEQTTSSSTQIHFGDKMVLSIPGSYNLPALSESYMKWSLNIGLIRSVSEICIFLTPLFLFLKVCLLQLRLFNEIGIKSIIKLSLEIWSLRFNTLRNWQKRLRRKLILVEF